MNNNQNNSNLWDDGDMQSAGFSNTSDDQSTSSKGGSSTKGKQGFSGMSADKRSSIAAKGGKVAHQKGTAHEWTSKEAAIAGRKGGQNSRSKRQQTDI